MENQKFVICSIYAPNDYRERGELWNWLTMLEDIPWIIGGDFNVVESPSDKKGGNKFEWKGMERLQWDRMINKLHLFYPISWRKDKLNTIWYTW